MSSSEDPTFAGLCSTCRHMRPVRSRSGSLFRLCLLSREDSHFPRYPTLPVLACRGYEEPAPDTAGSSEARWEQRGRTGGSRKGSTDMDPDSPTPDSSPRSHRSR